MEENKNSKKTARLIISVVSAAVFIAALAFLIIKLPGFMADKAYNKAVELEQAYDYEAAVESYQKIKQSDARYPEAAAKIALLNERIEVNKKVADAITAFKNVTGADVTPEKLEGVCISTDKLNVAFTVDGIGYRISDTKADENRYFTCELDSEKNLYVIAYKPSANYKGWLSTITDSVKQEASNLLFKSNTANYTSDNIQLQVYKAYFEAK